MLKIQKTFTNSIGMEFIEIPVGEFIMGTDCIPNATPNCIENETPPRQVKIAEPFYMGKYEVTQAQWYAVMRTTPWYFNYEKVGSDTRQHPVEKVSWKDAQKFIKKLNKMEKNKDCTYRLPTEAEWEYAARGSTKTEYFFGNTDEKLLEYAWCKNTTDKKTHLVGQLKPNFFGLYDIIGNVWEWCEDSWHNNYRGAPIDSSAWKNNNGSGVLRGGSWLNNSSYCRSAARFGYGLVNRSSDTGFRLVCD